MLRARRRRPTRPLLAVAAISLAACGSTAVPAAITADPAATVGATSPLASATTAAAVATQEPGAAMPRVTPDGHPVCGNVTFRAPPSGDCPPR